MPVARIGVSLEGPLLKAFDRLVRDGGYRSRSEALRNLIRTSLARRKVEAGREANVAGPREFLTPTWCPAFAKSFAAVPPMCPAPTIPIRIPASPERAGEDVRELWIFGLRIRFALSTEN